MTRTEKYLRMRRALRKRTRKALLLAVLTAMILQLSVPIGWIMADTGPAGQDVTDKVVIDEDNTSIALTTGAGSPITPDSSGKYTNIPAGAKIKINHTFRLPDNNGLPAGDPDYEEYDYNENDYYAIPLPEGINFAVPTEGLSLKDDSDNIVGTLKIEHSTTDGKDYIIVYFSSYAVANSNVMCQFQIDGTFTNLITAPGTEATINFMFAGTSFSVTIKQSPPPPVNVTATVTKNGNYNASDNTIDWTVNVTPSQKTGSVVVEDVYSANQSFVNNSFVVNAVAAADSELGFEPAARKIIYSFTEEIEGTQVITYKTRPVNGAFNTESGSNESTQFSNTATVKIGGDTKGTATGRVSTNWIQKYGQADGSSANDANIRLIHWRITVNSNSVQAINGAVITDILPDGLGLVADSVKLGAAVVSQDTVNNPPAPGQYSLVSNGDGTQTLKYSFNGPLSGEKILYYDTVVTNPNAYLNSNAQKTFTNSAVLKWTEQGALGTPSDSYGVGIGKDVIYKTASPASGQYSPSQDEITWTIYVNRNKVAITDAVVTDDIPLELEYISGSFSINDTDGEFSYDGTAGPNKSGTITYRFRKATDLSPRTINSTYTITFKTRITDHSRLFANGTVGYGNTVKLAGTGVKDGLQSSSNTRNFDSQVVDKAVAISYDYVTRKVKWQIVVNRNRLSLTNARIEDTIPAGMKFLPDTLVVANESGSDVTGSAGGLIPAPVLYPDTDTVHNDFFTYTFTGAINQKYTITYETQVKEAALLSQGDKTFANQVVFKSDYGTATASVSQTVVNKVVEKRAVYNSGSDYIQWEIPINTNSLTLSGISLSDTLQSGLVPDLDTVKLYKMSLSADGTLIKGELVPDNFYTASYDSGTRVFSFAVPGQIADPYQLEFITDVMVDNLTVSNSISLSGTGISAAASTSGLNVVVDNASGSGSASNGRIAVVKVDASDPVTTLNGAKFKLTDLKGQQVGSLQTTSGSGEALFDSLRFKTYYLQEVEPPYGYLLDDTPVKIRLTPEESGLSYTFSNVKALGSVSFRKNTAAGQPLEGAGFTLYDGNGSAVGTAVSDSNGNVLFTGIPIGDYTVRETDPPAGFYKSNEIISVRVALDASKTGTVVTVTPEALDNTKASGNISFVKNTSEGKPLQGAEFTLYNEAGKAIGNAVSDAEGSVIFSGIPVGDYTVEETTPPAGYYKSETRISASIGLDVPKTGIVVTVTPGVIVNMRIPDLSAGSVIITKTDEASKPLKGAVFTLYNAVGNAVRTATSDDKGKVLFGNIAQGNYTIRETSAPAGYVLSDRIINVKMDGSTKTFDFVNKAETARGTIVVIKTDEKGSTLAGAEFSLYDGSGTLLGKAVTGKDGRASFQDLSAGDYTVEESKAPEGYVLSSGRLTVTVDGEDAKILSFINKPAGSDTGTPENGGNPGDKDKPESTGNGGTSPGTGTIRINKLDEKSKPLAGAEFTLTDKAGSVLATAVSNTGGLVLFDGLAPGSYFVQETKAPAGYGTVSDRLTLKVEAGKAYVYSFVNIPTEDIPDDKIPRGWVVIDDPAVPTGTLPKSGAMLDTVTVSAAGGVLILAGAVWLVCRRRRRAQ